MDGSKRPDVLGRDKRTGRKGVLGKPTAYQRAKSARFQRKRNTNTAVNRRYTDRYYRSPTFFLTSLFTGKGRYPKLITIILFIILIYMVFTKLVLTKS